MRSLFMIGAAIYLSVIVLSLRGQASSAVEYRSKAHFLSNLPNFVEWPPNAFAASDTPFLICVFGDFSFGTSLMESSRGINVHGHRVDVKWARKESELHACQIVFVSRGDARRYAKFFDAVKGTGILTVGETPDFLDAGGAVTFSFQQEALQFEINLGAVDTAHLKVSSRLLALARRVINKVAEAKS